MLPRNSSAVVGLSQESVSTGKIDRLHDYHKDNLGEPDSLAAEEVDMACSPRRDEDGQIVFVTSVRRS